MIDCVCKIVIQHTQFIHIMNLYDKMKLHHIPFIDSLDKVKIEGQSVPFVILSPKGIQYKPQSEKQLVIALHCVLTAVEVFFFVSYIIIIILHLKCNIL